MKRAKREEKRLPTRLGRVIRGFEGKTEEQAFKQKALFFRKYQAYLCSTKK
ncbi:hypothetical protein DB41_AS00070 [Neochlamydia sp. TUME1]|nr:hypothetical protein DB41_AS00070 [Neochlamydia sp. TUME1]